MKAIQENYLIFEQQDSLLRLAKNPFLALSKLPARVIIELISGFNID